MAEPTPLFFANKCEVITGMKQCKNDIKFIAINKKNHEVHKICIKHSEQFKEGYQLKQRIFLTKKVWNKYDPVQQELILSMYDVILDYKTGKEKTIEILKQFNKQNYPKTQKKIREFWKKYDKAMNTMFGEKNRKRPSVF